MIPTIERLVGCAYFAHIGQYINSRQILHHTSSRSPHLHDVLSSIVKAVNFIKTIPLKTRFFNALCIDLGSEHTSMLFHNETRWLSTGKVMSRVSEPREEIRQFLESEGQVDVANMFNDENIQFQMAYMSDIFSFMYTLNPQMQGSNRFYHDVFDNMLDKF